MGGKGKLFGLVPQPRNADVASKTRSGGMDGYVREDKSKSESTTGDHTFIDQPRKSPDRDALFTFSIDVDTASYY